MLKWKTNRLESKDTGAFDMAIAVLEQIKMKHFFGLIIFGILGFTVYLGVLLYFWFFGGVAIKDLKESMLEQTKKIEERLDVIAQLLKDMQDFLGETNEKIEKTSQKVDLVYAKLAKVSQEHYEILQEIHAETAVCVSETVEAFNDVKNDIEKGISLDYKLRQYEKKTTLLAKINKRVLDFILYDYHDDKTKLTKQIDTAVETGQITPIQAKELMDWWSLVWKALSYTLDTPDNQIEITDMDAFIAENKDGFWTLNLKQKLERQSELYFSLPGLPEMMDAWYHNEDVRTYVKIYEAHKDDEPYPFAPIELMDSPVFTFKTGWIDSGMPENVDEKDAYKRSLVWYLCREYDILVEVDRREKRLVDMLNEANKNKDLNDEINDLLDPANRKKMGSVLLDAEELLIRVYQDKEKATSMMQFKQFFTDTDFGFGTLTQKLGIEDENLDGVEYHRFHNYFVWDTDKKRVAYNPFGKVYRIKKTLYNEWSESLMSP